MRGDVELKRFIMGAFLCWAALAGVAEGEMPADLPDFSWAGYRAGEEPLPSPKPAVNLRDIGGVGDGWLEVARPHTTDPHLPLSLARSMSQRLNATPNPEPA